MNGNDAQVVNYQSFVQNQIFIMYSYEVLKDALLRLGKKAEMWNKATGWKSILFFWKKPSPTAGGRESEECLGYYPYG